MSISKLMGTDISSLAKAWGTNVSSLSKIMGTAVTLSPTLSPGTPAVFESAASYFMGVTMMDSTHAIVCYRDNGNSSYGTACCLTLSGTTITAGTPTVFENASTNYISVTTMDSTHAIVCYRDDGNSNYGTACCLTLSGTDITAGTPVVYENGGESNYNAVCSMDSTHAIVCYQDAANTYKGTACCLNLSGTTITAETPVVFESGSTYYTAVCSMDSSHAIVVYKDQDNLQLGTSCCLNLSGSTVTAETPVVFSSAGTGLNLFSICKMDSTHAIVCYGESGIACCLSLSGSAITAGSETTYGVSGANKYNAVAALSNTNAVVVYDDTAGAKATSRVLMLSGTTVSAGNSAQVEPNNIWYSSICAMDSTKAIAVYTDTGNSYYGTACCLTVA